MKARLKVADVRELARRACLVLQRDCGGFRLVREDRGGYVSVLPDGGICPTTTLRACETFLRGCAYEREIWTSD